MRPSLCLRALLAITLGLLTTFALAWLASLQTRAGSIVRNGMTWRPRNPAQNEGEGWLRAHIATKPGWRSVFGQAVAPLGYESWTPTPRTPEQEVRGRVRPLALPWLDGRRPWPVPGKNDMVYVDEYGWPLRALYVRTFGMLATDPTDHLLDLHSIAWFAHRPLGDYRGLPIGIIWPGFLADAGAWSLPWAAVCFAEPARRRLRLHRGRCAHCNYDLRATPRGSPCPECGRTRACDNHPTRPPTDQA